MSVIKISVIGAGAVGTACALEAARRSLGRVVLLDLAEGIPAGRALDLAHSGPIGGFAADAVGTADWEETAGSRVVIVTAGSPRKPGMSRDDLLSVNAAVIRSVVSETVRLSPDAVLILVTNPLDALCHLAWRVSGFSPGRVVGQAGILDSARLRFFLGEALGVSPLDVSAVTLGGHGDSMLPLIRSATAGGIPVSRLLAPEKLREIIQRTAGAGAEIVGHLKTGGACLAPGAAAAAMAEAVVRDQKRIYPCSAYLDGQYGLRDIFMGVPVVLGANGVERILEADLDAEEREAFSASAAAVRQTLAKL